MTEPHAERLAETLNANTEAFDAAAAASDWPGAKVLWLKMLFAANTVIHEARAARIEADALAAELEVYRPTRSAKPPAPLLDGYAYVFTAKFPWVCAAVERRELVRIPAMFGTGYQQEHYTPERKTLCGKATTFPVSERFASGGWPRMHELCPECVEKLASPGLMESAGVTP